MGFTSSKCMSPSILGRITCMQGEIAIEPSLHLLAFFSLVVMNWFLDGSFIHFRSHRYRAFTLESWLITHHKPCVTLLDIAFSILILGSLLLKLGFLLGLQEENWHTQCAVVLSPSSHYQIAGFLLLSHPCCDFDERNTFLSVYQFCCCWSCPWLSVQAILWILVLVFLWCFYRHTSAFILLTNLNISVYRPLHSNII